MLNSICTGCMVNECQMILYKETANISITITIKITGYGGTPSAIEYLLRRS